MPLDPRKGADNYRTYRSSLRTAVSRPFKLVSYQLLHIHFQNLNDNVTEQYLSRLLSEIATVDSISIPQINSRRTGHALVVLTRQADLVNVIKKFNNTAICGQKVRTVPDPAATAFNAAIHALRNPKPPPVTTSHLTNPSPHSRPPVSDVPTPKRARTAAHLPDSTPHQFFNPASRSRQESKSYNWSHRDSTRHARPPVSAAPPPLPAIRLDNVGSRYSPNSIANRLDNYYPVDVYPVARAAFIVTFRNYKDRDDAIHISSWLRYHGEISVSPCEHPVAEQYQYRHDRREDTRSRWRSSMSDTRHRRHGDPRPRDANKSPHEIAAISSCSKVTESCPRPPASHSKAAQQATQSAAQRNLPKEKQKSPSPRNVSKAHDGASQQPTEKTKEKCVTDGVPKEDVPNIQAPSAPEKKVFVSRAQLSGMVIDKCLNVVKDQIIKLHSHKYKTVVNKAVTVYVKKQEQAAKKLELGTQSLHHRVNNSVQNRPMISMFSQMAEYYSMKPRTDDGKPARKTNPDIAVGENNSKRSRFGKGAQTDNRRAGEDIDWPVDARSGKNVQVSKGERRAQKRRAHSDASQFCDDGTDGANADDSFKRNEHEEHRNRKRARQSIVRSISSDDEDDLEQLLVGRDKMLDEREVEQSSPVATTSEDDMKKEDVKEDEGTCARTAGYLMSDMQGLKQQRQPPNNLMLNSGILLESSRETRQHTRRIRKGISELNAEREVLSLNFLQQRKKNLRFAKSKIHGMGLYALEDIEAGTFVVEYIGEIVRRRVADEREKLYTRRGMGDSYLFRLSLDLVVDATRKGALSRFINHSCDPNVIAKIIMVGGENKIVFYSKKFIKSGDELTYDYKFDYESEDKKIPCLCGSPLCRKTLN